MTNAGKVYGEALYDLAKTENAAEEIGSQLNVLAESFAAEPDYLKLLSSRNIPKQERCAVLDDSFRGKVHPYVLNFLKILTEKGYAKHFSDCRESYQDRYNIDHDILPVKALTAVALTEDQSARLSRKLGELTGKQITLINVVDPTILGGIRLDYDGKRLDDTVSGRLGQVRELLKNTVL